MIVVDELKMGLKDWEQLQEGPVFIHCIVLPCGVKEKLKEQEIGLDLHWWVEHLCLRRQIYWASTRECDEK